jgi:hypothetical protein
MASLRDAFRKITTKRHKYSSEEDFKRPDGTPMTAPDIMRLSVDDVPEYIVDLKSPQVFAEHRLKRMALERLISIKANKKHLEREGKSPDEIQRHIYKRQYEDVMFIDQQYINQEASKRDRDSYYATLDQSSLKPRPATASEIDALVSSSMGEVMRQRVEQKMLLNRLNRLKGQREVPFTKDEMAYMTSEEIAESMPSVSTSTQRGKGKKTRTHGKKNSHRKRTTRRQKKSKRRVRALA